MGKWRQPFIKAVRSCLWTNSCGLENGRACLREMLAQLPAFYNWQFAFLKGFQPWFQRPLDVEKWWALTVVRLPGASWLKPGRCPRAGISSMRWCTKAFKSAR